MPGNIRDYCPAMTTEVFQSLPQTLYAELTVGRNTEGYDAKLFGASTGKYWLWDASADKMIIVGSADLGSSCEADAYTVAGSAGCDFGPGAPASITIVKGIVTACT